ncbi:hypothetical protein R3P38DRAFT_2770947 [Favolaschia claudopus]|uniref:Uncharacterized protein n=1 Tax=Favolaschia claudopus TaxID=2862362 RepID=A0AAW0CCR9_9AGAR
MWTKKEINGRRRVSRSASPEVRLKFRRRFRWRGGLRKWSEDEMAAGEGGEAYEPSVPAPEKPPSRRRQAFSAIHAGAVEELLAADHLDKNNLMMASSRVGFGGERNGGNA